MSIQVYERFDEQSDPRGDLWQSIEWDFAAPTWSTTTAWAWQLKCDWRMPAHGILRFMHPARDDAVEFRYDTPSLMLPNHTPGRIKQSSFTPELKAQWDALPLEWSCEIGERNGRALMTLTCTKDIVDAMQITPLGELYIYRPTEIRIG